MDGRAHLEAELRPMQGFPAAVLHWMMLMMQPMHRPTCVQMNNPRSLLTCQLPVLLSLRHRPADSPDVICNVIVETCLSTQSGLLHTPQTLAGSKVGCSLLKAARMAGLALLGASASCNARRPHGLHALSACEVCH